jgi:two-component system, NtrC family, response regulator AtoC
MTHILIVDDEVDSAMVLKQIVTDYGFTVTTASTLAQAKAEIQLRMPDAILTDMILPDGTGFEIFGGDPPKNVEMILMTGHSSMDTSIEALRLGFRDYLIKPVNIQRLKRLLDSIPKPSDLKDEIDNLRKELLKLGRFGKLWGTSPAMQKVYEQISRVSPCNATVLIIGESGTGKEVVAQTIHELSTRKKNIFLAVNCSAISPQLIESELFGHKKGSFTGATTDRIGYFEKASSGTLFLDEITEMPFDMQAKLLRVLETGCILPVGSNTTIQTDVRIVAATNKVPEEAVAEGNLREDLMYRLQVFPLYLPPLRERLEDTEILAEYFLQELNRIENQRKLLTSDALDKIRTYTWPGNVRELRNAIQRAFIMTDRNITAACLLNETGAASRSNKINLDEIMPGMTINDIETVLIKKTIIHCNDNKEKAALMLGISLKTLYNKIKLIDAVL